MQHHKQRYFIQGTSEWQGNGAVHHSSENWRNLLRFLPNCYRFDLVVTENRKKIFWGLRKIAKNNLGKNRGVRVQIGVWCHWVSLRNIDREPNG
jgi:hypothetical protein